jgi:hypothetical protein
MKLLAGVAAAGALAAGVIATTAATAATATAATRAVDGDADLVASSKVRLEAETRGAARVTFVYGGRRHAGRLTGTDREDGTREWARTVTALRSDRAAGRVVSFKVRACDASGACTTRSFRERVEWDD